MKVLELKGHRSLRALNAFHALILGVKMLPAYASESYEDFLGRVNEMDEDGQRKVITEAVLFVELGKDETEALLSFCCDVNGVPYGASNIGSLNPKHIVDCIVAVCMEIAKLKIDLASESEKKNSVTSQ